MGLSTNQSNQIRNYFLQGIWLIGTEFSHVFFPSSQVGHRRQRPNAHSLAGQQTCQWRRARPLVRDYGFATFSFNGTWWIFLEKMEENRKMLDLPRENAVFFFKGFT